MKIIVRMQEGRAWLFRWSGKPGQAMVPFTAAEMADYCSARSGR